MPGLGTPWAVSRAPVVNCELREVTGHKAHTGYSQGPAPGDWSRATQWGDPTTITACHTVKLVVVYKDSRGIYYECYDQCQYLP